MARPKVLIVGAGFAGFHCARELERLLRPDEAAVRLTNGTELPSHTMVWTPGDARQTAAAILADDQGGWPA